MNSFRGISCLFPHSLGKSPSFGRRWHKNSRSFSNQTNVGVPMSRYDETLIDYSKMEEKLHIARKHVSKQRLTYAEKITYAHLLEPQNPSSYQGNYLQLLPGKIQQPHYFI